MKPLFRFLAGVLCVVLLLGNSQCTNTNNTSNGSPVFVTTLQIEDAGGNAATSFTTGTATTIQFVLTVRNRGSSSQTLFFSGSEQANFAVVDSAGNVVWTSDNGTPACNSGSTTSGCTGTSVTIAGGSSQTFTASWNQVDDANNLVPVGSYEVIGGATVFNTVGLSSTQDTSGDVMPFGIPTAAQLFPSIYRSPLMQFNIVQ